MAQKARSNGQAGHGDGYDDRPQPSPSPSPRRHRDLSLTPVTHATTDFLSAAWHEMEPELRRVLRGLLQPADIDDVIQEVFIRLTARAERRPLAPEAVADLARLAAWRLGLNAVRNAGVRAQPQAELPELVGSTDLEEQAVWHLDLDRVLHVIAEMSESDRQAIARSLTPERGTTKREQDRLSLRLYRARGRLRARVSGVLGGLPIWRWRTWQAPLFEAGAMGASMVIATMLAIITAPPKSPVDPPSTALSPAVVRAVADHPSPASVATATGGGVPKDNASAKVTRPEVRLPVPTASNPYNERVLLRVPGPDGDTTEITGSDRGDRTDLACIGGDPMPQMICVPHPLRQQQ